MEHTRPRYSVDPAGPYRHVDRRVRPGVRVQATRSGASSRPSRSRPGDAPDVAGRPWLGHSVEKTPRVRSSPSNRVRGAGSSTAALQRRWPWGPIALASGFAVLGLTLLVRAPAQPLAAGGAATAVPWSTESKRPSPSSPHQTVPPNRVTGGIPVPGDGPAGDAAVQRLLDRSSPPDLPRSLEARLVQLGMQVWEADVTGRGRERWPKYFGSSGPAAGGGRSVYRDVRIQAGIARRAGSGLVDVRLVWAATDPSGDRRDGRLAQLSFRPVPGHPNRWEPVS
ncbi:hypothetical protein SNOUR_43620 [Streptomyces noursei ATCC 11455]|nr:hypothetical protein SNOUR_00330 [Streptomyces noursei ATCC 11455]ANZ21946.1 hypothetical protein SNOUR_43620 [Streptomyces noursei ATCC 11455]